jgi:hypothetical protein
MFNINTLTLDNRIYPNEIIMQAVSDYDAIANITLTYSIDGNKCVLVFEDLKAEYKLVKNEFCNYLIQLYAVVREETGKF